MQGLLEVTSFLGSRESRFFTCKPGRIRKLVGFPDLEGKTRVVAIMDFWSQTALRPTHDLLFKILRLIPQDMTFNQGAFKDVVTSWGPRTLYSVDLTAATDRFPIVVIQSVLGGHFGRDFAIAWRDIMVGYPFHTGDGREVSYGVGNPMGASSS